ncbi:MAG: hypothetical protein DWQ39_09025 [Bacteroidetes bacterium]|nr:MAG: hypothetical protein DWQ39_09025 [Bacteroidota bacterium]
MIRLLLISIVFISLNAKGQLTLNDIFFQDTTLTSCQADTTQLLRGFRYWEAYQTLDDPPFGGMLIEASFRHDCMAAVSGGMNTRTQAIAQHSAQLCEQCSTPPPRRNVKRSVIPPRLPRAVTGRNEPAHRLSPNIPPNVEFRTLFFSNPNTVQFTGCK